MKAKKSEKANLENKRGLYFQLGLIISLCATLSAFEWSSTSSSEKTTLGDLDALAALKAKMEKGS